MPELPDITLYIESLERRVLGRAPERIRILSPSILHTFEPPVASAEGRPVKAMRRIGKRIVFEFDGELFLILHLMIAGRLHWKERGATPARKVGHAAIDFEHGTLTLTEAGTHKRATIHMAQGEAALAGFDPGGLEPLGCDLGSFTEALQRESHTLKRSLTDPRLFSGIGNAYSDEILHRARLSPVKLTGRLGEDEIERLWLATQEVLVEWIERLRAQRGDGFPEKVTAFRPEMAVHGRFGEPCPDCGARVQRIVRAKNEVNYCASCQNEGRLLADRALSRLLRKDWPKTLDELERRRMGG